ISSYRTATLVLCAGMLICAQRAHADIVTFTGKLISDGAAVGSGDPVITDPSTIHVNDPFSVSLTYNPASFTHSGNSYTLTDAILNLTFDGYSFNYSSAAGNYLALFTPGAFGAGTTSFLFCSSLADCGVTDFLTLYFKGTVTDPSTLQAQAGGLSGDPTASPSEFEFLRNFDDFSQTDLQGTLSAANGSAVPEPSVRGLLALVLV